MRRFHRGVLKDLPMKQQVYAFHVAKWLFAIGAAFMQSFPGDLGWVAAFMAIDFISRLLAGWKKKDISSTDALKGFLLKCHALLVVYALHLAQKYAVSVNSNIKVFDGMGKFMASYLIAVELLSVLENYSNAGGNLPTKVVMAMKLAKKFIPSTMTPEEVQKALNAGLLIDVETKVTTTEKVTISPSPDSPITDKAS